MLNPGGSAGTDSDRGGCENAFVFCDPDSEAAAAMRGEFKWDRHYFPVVEVQWEHPADSPPYLRITRLVRVGWRGH